MRFRGSAAANWTSLVTAGGLRGQRQTLGVAAWSLAALVWVVTDWAVNQEDVAFHAAAAVIFGALVALGAGTVHAARALPCRRLPPPSGRLRPPGPRNTR